MPSRSRKKYFEKKKKEEEVKAVEEVKKKLPRKRRRISPKVIGVLLFILSFISSIAFTLTEQYVIGLIVTSLIVFFSIQQFKKEDTS